MADTATDWIEWAGGECPLPADTAVEIRTVGGETSTYGKAGFWGEWWQGLASNPCDNIAAYRVVPA